EEGTLIEWLMADGDPVRTGDVVCVIESDKAQLEVESFETGVLRIPAHSPAPGTKVPVGTLLGYIIAPGEALPEAEPAGTPPPQSVSATPPRSASREEVFATHAPTPATGRRGQPAVSPRARRVAAELRVDSALLRGSGRTGRIVERDVRAAGVDRTSSLRRLI